MQVGMVGLGRMGSNMARRLMRGGHRCVVHDVSPDAVSVLASEGGSPSSSLAELAGKLAAPRVVWLMLPVGIVDDTLGQLAGVLEPGDTVIDGGNSHYKEAPLRAAKLASRSVHFVDCGTSGGVWGLERGYCLMLGGETQAVARLEPILATLAPSGGATPGHLHCGPHGAGHFVKMVHNGIEYGLMAAYAEGLNLLEHAPGGYDFDLAAITQLWRRGSVITSWLLDLTADALARSPSLEEFSGRVEDSGEGRWTVQAALESSVPAHVLTAALFERFDSRGEALFQNRVLSAMRYAFGGHREKGDKG
jgi:6-phosphogluconate dehydrogenase